MLFQAPRNAAILRDFLSLAGYRPKIYVCAAYWCGNIDLNKSNDLGIDIGIRHKSIPPDIFDSLDELIDSLNAFDNSDTKAYRQKLQKNDISSTCEDIYKLITDGNTIKSHSSMRGYYSEYITWKKIERSLPQGVILDEIKLSPLNMLRNDKITHLLHSGMQIDEVVSCESFSDFSELVDNLRKDESIELSIRNSSGLY